MEIFDKAKAIYGEKDLKFNYYRLADGIKNILDKLKEALPCLVWVIHFTELTIK
jgi:hypothetical protein